jgi:hypothetical protein
MVWALRTVFLMIQESAWSPGGRVDPPEPPPFDAFRQSALRLACPFSIVRRPSLPLRPRRRRAPAAA